MEGIDVAWVEEAQSIELSPASRCSLRPSVRKARSWSSRSTGSTELDPVYVRYVLNAPAPRHTQAKVNFDVLEACRLTPRHLEARTRGKIRPNPQTMFAHVWLGEPRPTGRQRHRWP